MIQVKHHKSTLYSLSNLQQQEQLNSTSKMKIFNFFAFILVTIALFTVKHVSAGDKGDTIIIGAGGHKKHHECHCGHDWGHMNWGGLGMFRRRR